MPDRNLSRLNFPAHLWQSSLSDSEYEQVMEFLQERGGKKTNKTKQNKETGKKQNCII